jgi:hypothetical protein
MNKFKIKLVVFFVVTSNIFGCAAVFPSPNTKTSSVIVNPDGTSSSTSSSKQMTQFSSDGWFLAGVAIMLGLINQGVKKNTTGSQK